MSDHLITTPAVLAPCEGCRRHVLACRSGGFRTYADPEPLTVPAEITAWLRDRAVFDVIGWGIPRRLYLEYRDLARIKGGRGHPVVGEHQCPSGRPAMAAAAGFELTYPFHKPEKKKKEAQHERDDGIPF